LPNKSKKNEIDEFLSSDLWVEMDLPEGSTPAFKAIIPCPEGRSQLAFMELNDDFFVLSSPFANYQASAAEQVFRVNETLFGLTIKFGLYCLAMPGLIETFSAENFREVVIAIAQNADDIERKLGGGDSL
jgi:hypothetical protein